MSQVKKTYKVNGMSCASCVRSIETILKAQNGINNASVNLAESSVLVDFDNVTIKAEGIKKAVDSIGFELLLEDENDDESERRSRILKYKIIVAIGLAIPVMLISMVFMHLHHQGWILLLLSIPVIFWSGQHFYVNAFKKLQHGSANMDTLVALGTGTAFLYSVFVTIYPQYFIEKGIEPHNYYESAVVVIALVLLGNFLEDRAKKSTATALKKLAGLQTKEAILFENGTERTISVEQLIVGNLIKIKPGQKVPLDGVVEQGESYLDESMISGEPLPVIKQKGQTLIGGTINQSGVLIMKVTQTGKNTVLAKIIEFVREAQVSKAPIQNVVDKVAAVFVPIVVGIALVSFGIWYFVGPETQFTHALITMVTVLVIACPCALGLATPTAIIVGMGNGARQGILIKNAVSLEQFHKIDSLVLDKTGTITEGKPKVTDFFSYSDEAPMLLKSIEQNSEHPLAKAVLAHFEDTAHWEVQKFNSISGLGVEAQINGKTYFLGNQALLEQQKVFFSVAQQNQIKNLLEAGKTLVLLSDNHECLAILGIDDALKSHVREAVAHFQEKGVEVVMLTGDNAYSAEKKATQAGIKKVIAGVLPTEKAIAIKALQKEGKIVAMAGDGINDAPALAQADVSIAMATGTDISIETAQVVLLNGDVSKLYKAYELSNKTVRTIKQNLFWAFIYNVIGIPIAAGALYPINGFLLNPMLAGGAMAFSSVSVVLNSLRNKQ